MLGVELQRPVVVLESSLQIAALAAGIAQPVEAVGIVVGACHIGLQKRNGTGVLACFDRGHGSRVLRVGGNAGGRFGSPSASTSATSATATSTATSGGKCGGI